MQITKVVAIIPKLGLTGGNLETERLLDDLRNFGCDVTLLAIFPSNAGFLMAILCYPFFLFKLFFKLLGISPRLLVLTHYTTLPFAFLKVSFHCNVLAFIQGFEWLFPSGNKTIQRIMKSYHLLCYQAVDTFVFGNRYLLYNFPLVTHRLVSCPGRPRAVLYPVGSLTQDSSFVLDAVHESCHDIGLILRNGWLKNEKMYYSVLSILFRDHAIAPVRVSAVNMLRSSTSSSNFSNLGVDLRDKMSHDDLCFWMSGLKLFLCLSVHEGFGLPPLEAMALGVVPLILSNGGCNSYMEPFPELVLSASSTANEIVDKILWVLSWREDYRQEQLSLLSSHANHYLSWASRTRLEAASKIAYI
jgi:hypothetical protein